MCVYKKTALGTVMPVRKEANTFSKTVKREKDCLSETSYCGCKMQRCLGHSHFKSLNIPEKKCDVVEDSFFLSSVFPWQMSVFYTTGTGKHPIIAAL
jgi:hypothetical protein